MREDEVFDDTGQRGSVHYQRALEEARIAALQRPTLQQIVPAAEQQWEDSPQGRLKHLVNDHMGTAEFALDMYIQVIEAGEHSGIHRHFSEEIMYVLEGEGYDLHWDPKFALDVEYTWTWQDEPKRFDWQKNDFVYIPSYVNHQHFAGPNGRVRFISATARFIKSLGLDGLEQIESV